MHIKAVPAHLVHKDCRRNYVNPNASVNSKDAGSTTPTAPRTLRSSTPGFSFKDNCLYCGQHAKFNGIKRGHDVYPVKTIEFKTTLKEMTNGRLKYLAYRPIRPSCGGCRILSSMQHKFLVKKKKQMPKSQKTHDTRISVTPGRPKKSKIEQAFLQVVKGHEERDGEQVTVNDLVREMEQICGEEVFRTVYTKKRLLGYFGSSIIVTNINGQPNFVTFKQNASEILHTFYERPKIEDPDEQATFIIHTAAKLIKLDIKSISSVFKLEYPSQDLISCRKHGLDCSVVCKDCKGKLLKCIYANLGWAIVPYFTNQIWMHNDYIHTCIAFERLDAQ